MSPIAPVVQQALQTAVGKFGEVSRVPEVAARHVVVKVQLGYQHVRVHLNQEGVAARGKVCDVDPLTVDVPHVVIGTVHR